jgi:retron-type reverse transcriptase
MIATAVTAWNSSCSTWICRVRLNAILYRIKNLACWCPKGVGMSGFTKFVKRTPTTAQSPTDHYRRRQMKKRFREHAQHGTLPTVDQIADPENLIQVFRELKQKAGQAPGRDGATYADLSPSEVGTCMRVLGEVVQRGIYHPSESLQVQIPKASGTGHRTLAIPSIMDRVISAALNNALSPYWDKKFLPGSMGFRPKKGPWDMLIELERTMVQQDRWILAIDDIKDAFDHVNLTDLMDDHRRHINDDKLLNLIEIILRGGTNPSRTLGIEQGNAYSPTALNIRLHHVHDLVINQGQPTPSWYRYADNLVYLTKDVPEGLQALSQSRALLQSAGFTLKGEDGPPVNLKEGQEAQILGFQVSLKDGQVCYGLGEGAWKGLKQSLEKAHEAQNSPAVALGAMRGWVGAYGVAFESTRTADVERVLQTAAFHGFRELATPEELWKEWQSSWARWQRRRKALWSSPTQG